MLLKQKKREYWKLSVYDNVLNMFIVHSVCLTKTQAVKMQREYWKIGLIARISTHLSQRKR